jgi:hypothetical protein
MNSTFRSQENAALCRIAKLEVERITLEREVREAELQRQISEAEAVIEALAAEYMPKVAASNARHMALLVEAQGVAGAGNQLLMELQGKQIAHRSRRTELKTELRALQESINYGDTTHD